MLQVQNNIYAVLITYNKVMKLKLKKGNYNAVINQKQTR